MKRVVLIVAIVAVCVVAVLLVRSARRDDVAELAYDVVSVTREPMWVKVSATGLVEPVGEVEVTSKASGVVGYVWRAAANAWYARRSTGNAEIRVRPGIREGV